MLKTGISQTEDCINKFQFMKKSFYIPESIIEKELQNEILSTLFLTWTGCYIKAYGHYVDNRVLDDHVLIYCVDGSGWLRLSEKTWKIKKGDIFLCPTGQIHSYGADGRDPWTKYWLHFRGSTAASYLSLLPFSMENPVMNIGINMKVLSCLDDIFEVLKTGYAQSNLLLASSYLANILCLINNLASKSLPSKSEEMNIEKVIAFMLENINSSLTLEQLAKFSNLSKHHFLRLFKEKTGYTPIDYYIRLKIQRACELLQISALKVNEIGNVLGFENQYYFSTSFKRIVGQSPQQYKLLWQSGAGAVHI